MRNGGEKEQFHYIFFSQKLLVVCTKVVEKYGIKKINKKRLIHRLLTRVNDVY